MYAIVMLMCIAGTPQCLVGIQKQTYPTEVQCTNAAKKSEAKIKNSKELTDKISRFEVKCKNTKDLPDIKSLPDIKDLGKKKTEEPKAAPAPEKPVESEKKGLTPLTPEQRKQGYEQL